MRRCLWEVRLAQRDVDEISVGVVALNNNCRHSQTFEHGRQQPGKVSRQIPNVVRTNEHRQSC